VDSFLHNSNHHAALEQYTMTVHIPALGIVRLFQSARRLAQAMRLLLIATCALACSPTTVSSGQANGAGGSATAVTSGGGEANRSASSGSGGQGGAAQQAPRVLLFSKTAGFRHEAIPTAIAALQTLAQQRDWAIEASEDASIFTPTALAPFDVVVWLLTSGDVLNTTQQAAFESYIRAGGGYVGVHSASDSEYDWPRYANLVGAYFAGHPPALQKATVRVERSSHLATTALPQTWVRSDEWYSFDRNPRAEVTVLLSLDESSYDVGSLAMGDHPIAWYHGYDGGRAFYTALGHSEASYADPLVLQHLAGGIEWAAGLRWAKLVVTEFDNISPNGTWQAHQPNNFAFEATPSALVMHDAIGANQHVVRRNTLVDASRPYVIETLFTIHSPTTPPPNSFCLNLNVAGDDTVLTPPSTWAVNVDVMPSGAVMKHMGFVNGAFHSLGDRMVPWAKAGAEYLLRAAVHTALDGSFAANTVTVTLLEAGVTREHFSLDYSAFPHQPEPNQPVRIGANTHGTDWTMRSLRVYYSD